MESLFLKNPKNLLMYFFYFSKFYKSFKITNNQIKLIKSIFKKFSKSIN